MRRTAKEVYNNLYAHAGSERDRENDVKAIESAIMGNIVVTEAWLVKYGQHLPNCARKIAYEGNDLVYYYTECTCGWAEIIEKLKGIGNEQES